MYLFVIFSFYAWWFWYRFSQLWFRHFKELSECKRELAKKSRALAHIDANPSVTDAIENGYKIPFLINPVSKFFQNFQNNQSALQNANFATCTVKELLKSGGIKETRAPPYIVNLLTVARNSHNKSRLILDLWYLNYFVYKDKIKFDDWRTMQDFVDNNGLLHKFDISQSYHHIGIDENHQKYLGFSWKFDGKIRYFCSRLYPSVYGLRNLFLPRLLFIREIKGREKNWVTWKLPPGKLPPGWFPPDNSYLENFHQRKFPPRISPTWTISTQENFHPDNFHPGKLPPGKFPPGQLQPRKTLTRKITTRKFLTRIIPTQEKILSSQLPPQIIATQLIW